MFSLGNYSGVSRVEGERNCRLTKLNNNTGLHAPLCLTSEWKGERTVMYKLPLCFPVTVNVLSEMKASK